MNRLRSFALTFAAIIGIVAAANGATTIVHTFIPGTGLSLSGDTLSATGSNTVTSVLKTANYTVVAADSGTYFDNSGAVGSVVLTLPAAAAGLQYCGTVIAAQTVEFLASGTDTISDDGTTGAAAGNIQSNATGNHVCVYARGTGAWFVTSATGSWSLT